MDLTKTQIQIKEKNKKRIESFSELEENWDSYGAKRISPLAIKRALIFVDCEIDVEESEKYVVVPTPTGGVQFEWDNVLIEIFPAGNFMIYVFERYQEPGILLEE